MSDPISVSVSLDGDDIFAGRLWSHRRRGTESMTFAYDEAFLADRRAYDLDPSLPLAIGSQQTPVGREIFGALSDCAPDTWGRKLLNRRETRLAKDEGRARRSFGEIDYLLGVRDDVRQGALRFAGPDGFLASADTGIPLLTSLGELLNAAEKLERGEETTDDLRILTHAGSSLGGARPKAHALAPDGRLVIAKFPSARDEDRDVMRWEHTALLLAMKAGITIPGHELWEIAGKPVLAVDRFDRTGDKRIGYVSALTMLGLADGDRASYRDIADVITTFSPRATLDLQELWRRMAFSVLISNVDDHLRNHGFLRGSTAGWTISPAFDLNPDPEGRYELHTEIDYGDPTASVDLLLHVAEAFRLDDATARAVLTEVSDATSAWREVASEVGLKDEIDRMEPAFEHRAADDARALTR